MIVGTVNRHLMPVIPINIRNEDDGSEQLELLLDTGFDGAIALELDLVHHHRLATRPTRQLLTPEFVSERDPKWGHSPPFTVESMLEGTPCEVPLLVLNEHPFAGMVGTEMLKFRRVTVDVMEEGRVTVDTLPPESCRGMRSRQFGKRKRQGPFRKDPEDYAGWIYRNLPWTSLQIRDSEGDWYTIRVNVDTGSSGELSLPPSWVSRLGLKLPNECEIETVNGRLPVHTGEVEVFWKGKRHSIECIRRNDGAPPLIGMKLLEGNRITIDFGDYGGTNVDVDIKPIPRIRPYMGGFLRSLADRFHL